MSKTRSPNYPATSLSEAIDRARILYNKDYKNTMSREVITEHLGYNGLNGASLRILSSLRQYGLIEGSGDELRLSSDAITLLVDPLDSPERREAIRRIALTPPLFAELSEKYPEGLPSEENLRGYLQKNGFTPKAAIIAAQVYRETMELAAHQGKRGIESVQVFNRKSLPLESQIKYREANSEANSLNLEETRSSDSGLGTVVIFPLPRGNVIEIRLKSKVLPQEFEQLRQMFELLRFSIVQEDE